MRSAFWWNCGKQLQKLSKETDESKLAYLGAFEKEQQKVQKKKVCLGS
jgi:hypothetical protein